MKLIYRTYRVELKPTQDQKVLLEKHFGCVRYVYNYFLNHRKEQYQLFNKSENYFSQAKLLPNLKKNEETSWLKEVNSQSLADSLRHLDSAYQKFFKGKSKFPRFKSKKSKNSFSVPQHFKIEQNRLHIPKFKQGIKYIHTRSIDGRICNVTVSKTPVGRYYASVLVEQEYEQKPKTGLSVGVDLGIKDLAVTSDGVRYKNNRYTKTYERKLAKAQKHLSRKKKGSRSFENQRRKVAKIHEKITNTRQDVLHKITTKLIERYDTIVVESLNVKSMMSNRSLSKHIHDASWGTFLHYLKYKADWNDKQVVAIDRFYPSSKTCNVCGWINQNLNLSMREWTCANGHVLDRDFNAAQNILHEGLKILNSAGTVENTDGDDVRLSNQQLSMKSEV